MNYYHLATHPLAKKLSNFIDKNWAAREKLVEFTKSVGAEDCCGWNFFFKDDKKPNKHWIKSKKQKWQNIAYTPSKKTPEGKALIEQLNQLPEYIAQSGVGMMLDLFGDEPKLNVETENHHECLIFNAVRDHGFIGFKRRNGEIYMHGSDFWLLENKDGVKEITNIEYREAE